MLVLQGIPRQAQPSRRARRQVLHQNIGTFDQRVQHLLRRVVLQVERQAFFAAVGPHKVGRQATHPTVVGSGKVTADGPLHLDDPRP